MCDGCERLFTLGTSRNGTRTDRNDGHRHCDDEGWTIVAIEDPEAGGAGRNAGAVRSGDDS